MGQKITRSFSNIYFWLLIALIIRLALVYPQYSGDTHTLVAWGQTVIQNPQHIYEQTFSGIGTPNYPPLILFLLGISWKFFALCSQVAYTLHFDYAVFPGKLYLLFTNFNMQASFIKLFPILADLGVGYMIYVWQKQSKHEPLIPALLYLLNPAVIYISAVWGQIESLPLFFLVLSLLLSQQKADQLQILSQLSFMAAVLNKQTALWLLPIYLVIWLKQSNIKVFILGILAQGVLFFLSFFPFGYLPWQSMKIFLDTLNGSSNYVADSAWNVWYWVFKGARVSDNVSFGLLTVRAWSLVALLSVYAGSFLFLLKKYTKQNIAITLFLVALADFFLQTRVHERHLAPAIVFFLLLLFQKKVWYYIAFTILSLYHLLNLKWSLKLPFF